MNKTDTSFCHICKGRSTKAALLTILILLAPITGLADRDVQDDFTLKVKVKRELSIAIRDLPKYFHVVSVRSDKGEPADLNESIGLGNGDRIKVKVRKDLPLSIIPAKARRGDQILSTFVLDQVLKPRLPEDAAASISLTASDLWPGKGWNFVFGQASLRDRVGVWSMHRYGDPDQDKSAYKRALLRTLKVAVHETGHLFSIEHCTAYACVMNGSNSLDETDRHPLWMCPQCMAKIAWATQLSPVLRYQRLAELAQGHGLTREVAFFQRSIEVLR